MKKWISLTALFMTATSLIACVPLDDGYYHSHHDYDRGFNHRTMHHEQHSAWGHHKMKHEERSHHRSIHQQQIQQRMEHQQHQEQIEHHPNMQSHRINSSRLQHTEIKHRTQSEIDQRGHSRSIFYRH
ncbi:hypothetical protein C8D76_1185 [Pasteurella langaaensis DSM 22999]|uniref:Lipoprotein n=1 Tax=Alitibacter langaaensis DSM 22999 TaxID=1122935 RepID=A0A2U0SKM7_9PAST|nr:hypothetical protein [Pasteurella langaaensis]PVX31905.1 hypothetical protein C8D76_1185 [Pasteurella langaaensis DSM 22999]